MFSVSWPKIELPSKLGENQPWCLNCINMEATRASIMFSKDITSSLISSEELTLKGSAHGSSQACVWICQQSLRRRRQQVQGSAVIPPFSFQQAGLLRQKSIGCSKSKMHQWHQPLARNEPFSRQKAHHPLSTRACARSLSTRWAHDKFREMENQARSERTCGNV